MQIGEGGPRPIAETMATPGETGDVASAAQRRGQFWTGQDQHVACAANDTAASLSRR